MGVELLHVLWVKLLHVELRMHPWWHTHRLLLQQGSDVLVVHASSVRGQVLHSERWHPREMSERRERFSIGCCSKGCTHIREWHTWRPHGVQRHARQHPADVVEHHLFPFLHTLLLLFPFSFPPAVPFVALHTAPIEGTSRTKVAKPGGLHFLLFRFLGRCDQVLALLHLRPELVHEGAIRVHHMLFLLFFHLERLEPIVTFFHILLAFSWSLAFRRQQIKVFDRFGPCVLYTHWIVRYCLSQVFQRVPPLIFEVPQRQSTPTLHSDRSFEDMDVGDDPARCFRVVAQGDASLVLWQQLDSFLGSQHSGQLDQTGHCLRSNFVFFAVNDSNPVEVFLGVRLPSPVLDPLPLISDIVAS
mmetsp:Transcript_4201/g.8068  ORF Transcript_4201/g.8068 Transcript_4201/m.8068 type:complete len:358 (-) Transcript_4201:677-1750(-)